MNIDDLDKIRKVDVPPFLFTRIQQTIENSRSLVVSKKIVLAMCLSFALVLFVNMSVLMMYDAQLDDTSSYARSMNLISNNSLYK